MPYIPQNQRARVCATGSENSGELAYLLYRDILHHIDGQRSFRAFAEVLGALEAVKAEFVSRELLSYEAGKREENGDV